MKHTSPHRNQLEFQNFWALELGGSILNVGCKEDPAGISSCSDDVTNLDVLDHDSYSKCGIKHIHNFIQADFLDWKPIRQYDTLVLGEVLEHCTDAIVDQFIERASNAIKDGGHFIITCPRDDRPKEGQHSDEGMFEIREGVTSWHQNVIEKDYLFEKLFANGFEIHHYETQIWLKEEGVYWHFVVAKKVSNDSN